jgi:hypothetical protein
MSDDPYRHPLWTRSRLVAGNPEILGNALLTYLRQLVMRASALGIVRPREIDETRQGAHQASLAAMKAAAASLQDYEALAKTYATENDELRAQREELNNQGVALKARIAELEEQRAALLTRVENAEVQLLYAPVAPQGLPPAAEIAEDEKARRPPKGEVRFYKKTGASPAYDHMELVKDCGCNAWQGGHAGEKAKKGIARLENGYSDWKSIQHCGSCTGGGMWRVKW